jgi:DeoR/GlpR family transcriptional regulator of sugar metabolism
MVVKAERQKQILEAIRKDRKVTLTELSERFGVSEITTRRDLKALEDQGFVELAHGGLVYLSEKPTEPPIIKRQQEQQEAKIKIGKAAAALVEEGESVFIGSGSTAMFVARYLKNRAGLTIVTNALSVINELAPYQDLNVIVLGGMLRPTELSMIGHITQQSLREVRVDKVIFGIRGIDIEAGLTNDYMPEILTDRAVLDMGSRVILVADHTKLGRIASAFVAPISRISTLVTDENANPEFLEAIRSKGIEVIVAT